MSRLGNGLPDSASTTLQERPERQSLLHDCAGTKVGGALTRVGRAAPRWSMGVSAEAMRDANNGATTRSAEPRYVAHAQDGERSVGRRNGCWVRVKALCRVLPAFSPRQGQSADDPIWGLGSRAALAIPTGDGRRRVMRDNRREVNRKQLLGPSKPSPGIHHGEIGPVHNHCHAPLVPLAPARVLNSRLPFPTSHRVVLDKNHNKAAAVSPPCLNTRRRRPITSTTSRNRRSAKLPKPVSMDTRPAVL
jgi:hypothetical protein